MQKRESETVEFKKSTSELKQGIVSLSSMLNKSGKGVLYFGVLNDSAICGQQIGKSTTHDISVEIKDYLRPDVIPSIAVENIDGKEIISVSVAGEDTPYSAYGRYYIRSDDEDLAMNDVLLQRYFERKSLDYSHWENSLSSYSIEAVDEDRLIKFFNEANECHRLDYVYKDAIDALTKLGLYKEGKLNNAGLYLFSNIKPVKLKLAIFNTDDRLTFSDIQLYEGNIFDCIEEGIRYISKNMRWKAEIIGSKRIEIPEIPLEAIREIVVNSFAHMKASGGGILNEIYFTPSMIKITNPGTIALGIDPTDFADGKIGPILRNPLIDLTLYKNGMIDSFATGFERTFRLCDERGIKYAYETSSVSFSFIFKRSFDTINDTKDDTKENRLYSIVELLKRDSGMSRNQIAKELNVSPATIARDLKSMQELHMIERIGSNKTGYWLVTDKQ